MKICIPQGALLSRSDLCFERLDTQHSMSNFKVIIVGGGPVGLIAGHCFSRAGIDFKILERREALDLNAGSSVALWPQSARVLDQLGLLDGAMAAYIPVKYKCNLLPDRRVLSKCDMNAAIQKLLVPTLSCGMYLGLAY